jgi:hypothetical protein
MRGCESNSENAIIQPFIYGSGVLMEHVIEGYNARQMRRVCQIINLKTYTPTTCRSSIVGNFQVLIIV